MEAFPVRSFWPKCLLSHRMYTLWHGRMIRRLDIYLSLIRATQVLVTLYIRLTKHLTRKDPLVLHVMVCYIPLKQDLAMLEDSSECAR